MGPQPFSSDTGRFPPPSLPLLLILPLWPSLEASAAPQHTCLSMPLVLHVLSSTVLCIPHFVRHQCKLHFPMALSLCPIVSNVLAQTHHQTVTLDVLTWPHHQTHLCSLGQGTPIPSARQREHPVLSTRTDSILS